MKRYLWILLAAFLFCGSIAGNEINDSQFVSRKLKQLAEQLPISEIPSLDTIVACPQLIEGKSVVLLYNDKHQVCHLGLSLFSEATKQILDVNICNFLERFFLELLLQKDAAAVDRKLQEYNIVMYIDGQKIVANNAASFQRALRQMEMPVNFSLRQKGNQAEAVWRFSSHALSVTFPLYRELIDGMDKVESDDGRPLHEVDNFRDISESHAHHRVGCAVIDSHALSVLHGCTGEYYVGHVPLQLVRGSRPNQIFLGAVQYFGGIVGVENGCSHGIAEAVARSNHAVIEQEPAFFR